MMLGCRELPDLGPRDRALCAIAEKLSANAPRVTVGDWEVLRAVGFDEMGCLEVAHIPHRRSLIASMSSPFPPSARRNSAWDCVQ